MHWSYSRLSCFASCPYQYYLRYYEKLETIPDTDAGNPLWLGLSIHKGVEENSVEAALEEYKSHYNVITDDNINWMMQIEYQLPRVLELLPKGGEHELEVKTDDFVGYIDYVCGDTLFDFKFSNNVESYSQSPQLSLYKGFLEKVRPDIHIHHLKYVMIPKITIRQKKTETIQEFRSRLQSELEASDIKLVEVEYDPTSIPRFKECCQALSGVTAFPKNETPLCKWCSYEPYCKRGIDWMLL